MTKSEKERIVQTALRLPQTLHTELHDAAENNFRSLNAEIIARLVTAQRLEERLDELTRQNAAIKSMLKEVLETVQHPR